MNLLKRRKKKRMPLIEIINESGQILPQGTEQRIEQLIKETKIRVKSKSGKDLPKYIKFIITAKPEYRCGVAHTSIKITSEDEIIFSFDIKSVQGRNLKKTLIHQFWYSAVFGTGLFSLAYNFYNNSFLTHVEDEHWEMLYDSIRGFATSCYQIKCKDLDYIEEIDLPFGFLSYPKKVTGQPRLTRLLCLGAFISVWMPFELLVKGDLSATKKRIVEREFQRMGVPESIVLSAFKDASRIRSIIEQKNKQESKLMTLDELSKVLDLRVYGLKKPGVWRLNL